MDTLRLKNYRCFEDTGIIDIKPITFLVGANSSGKSSFLKFFPLLKQSMNVKRNGVFLWLSNDVDFKDFNNTVKDGDGSIELSFQIDKLNIFNNRRYTSRVIDNVTVTLKISRKNDDFDFLEELNINFYDQCIIIRFDSHDNVEILINGKTIQSDKEKVKFIGTNSLLPRLLFFKDKNFDDEHSIFCYEELRSILNRVDDLENVQFRSLRRFLFTPHINSTSEFTKHFFKTWDDVSSVTPQVDTNRINNLYLYYHINNIIDSINLNVINLAHNIVYIRPLRATTERYYRFQNYNVDEIDADGKNLAMFLYNLDAELKEKFKLWTKNLLKFEIDIVANNGHIELKISEDGGAYRNMVDIGFGYTQLLPIVAIIWKSIYMDFERKDGQKIKHELLIVMEQPELHLHPRFQARFADLLTEMISYCKNEKKDIRFIIETHSEIILNKIGENIALEKFDREDTNVVLFNAKGENMEKYVEISTYSKDGFLTNWPMGFFAEHVD